MILIVDNTHRKMRREIRDLLFSRCIPCAVTDTEHLQKFLPCEVIIATEAYILPEVKYMADIYGSSRVILYDENEDLFRFILRTYAEYYNAEKLKKSFMLEFKEGELLCCNKSIRLTDTEKMIFKMILYSSDWVSRESLSLYCLKDSSADSGSISVHISNINKKVKAATGSALIEFKRFSGYRIGIK